MPYTAERGHGGPLKAYVGDDTHLGVPEDFSVSASLIKS
jgi:hypothetical protein